MLVLQMSMNIGVDFDGVIVDSEKRFKYHFEKFAFLKHGREVKTRVWRSAQKCFDLPKEDVDKYFINNLGPITLASPFMEGAREVLEMLRERGHKLFLVTARNTFLCEDEVVSAQKKVKELGFKFDGEFWSVLDKVACCKENNITVMIDDCNKNCRKLMENGIHTLYFREKGVEKLPEGEYLVDVHNWIHIYKEILKLERR